LVLFGDSHVTQIDPVTSTIVSDRVFSGVQFDQGTVDGKRHAFVASNFGNLLFMDYSNTGLVGDASNFVALPFLDTNLDDVAPLSGSGAPPTPGPVCFEPPENNDVCVGPFGGQTIDITVDGKLITGKLEERFVQGAEPDTWLCVVDKFDNILASDDNGAIGVGNGKGSGLWSSDADNNGWADILVDNGDGTYSLRLVVTGFPDGFDGNCNGFFQNAPHGQIGQFCLHIEYVDANGGTIRFDDYTDEFITGAEAFRLNFTAPAGSTDVHINIDNTCGRDPVCLDHDYMCFSGLQPLESYCVTVVGGLDANCNPTDTQLCWFDKNCAVIGTDDNSGPAAGYSELCVIADVNGNICIGVSGGGDADCDGLVNGAPHGVCGTYTLKVAFNGTTTNGGGTTCPQAEMAALGDINLDGVVDAVDLARLLSNWGAITAR